MNQFLTAPGGQSLETSTAVEAEFVTTMHGHTHCQSRPWPAVDSKIGIAFRAHTVSASVSPQMFLFKTFYLCCVYAGHVMTTHSSLTSPAMIW